MLRQLVTVLLGGVLAFGSLATTLAAPAPSGSWSPIAPMWTSRSAPALATGLDGRLYAFGGLGVLGEAPPCGCLEWLPTAEAYLPAMNTWEPLPPMAIGRAAAGAAAGKDGRLYVFGGQNADGYLDDAEAYDPDAHTWAPLPPMPTPRSGLAVVAGPDGRLYALGGRLGERHVGALEVYAPDRRTWTALAPMPTARAMLVAAFGADGRLYALGGNTDHGPTGAAEVYDPATNAWAAVAPMPTPRMVSGARATDGEIYALGGEDAAGRAMATVEVYDPAGNTWAAGPALGTPRFNASATAGADGRLYTVGGCPTDACPSPLRSGEVYTPGPAPNPPAVGGAPTPPAACRFVLGFAALHDLNPADVGACVDDQAFAANGDAVQHTTKGLLAWRKADNWTAFTDGYHTWINGPNGLQERLNSQRFAWEANPDGLPLAR